MYHLVDFCRLCLTFKGEFTVMWLDDIMEKVTACISELDFDNNLPLLICNACLEKVDDFFRFRNQCLQSEFFIGSYVNKLLNGNYTFKRSTVLKVNVIENFGTSNKYKSNVSVRKAPKTCRNALSTNCNVYLKDCLKSGPRGSGNITDDQETTSVARETAFKVNKGGGSEVVNPSASDDRVATPPIDNSQMSNVKTDTQNNIVSTKKTVEENNVQSLVAKSSSNINDQTAGTVDFVEEDDDVFVEEEDDYSIYEPELLISAGSPGEIVYDNASPDANDKEVANLNLCDPENLLVNNGQRKEDLNVQTDLSERVKLHKRNAKVKPVYRLDDFFNDSENNLEKQHTSANKKSPTKKFIPKSNKTEENEPGDQETSSKFKQSHARKSTSKHSLHLKKNNKVKFSRGSCELWKAACRNWTLQRMQTSGHVSSGRRNSPNLVHNVDTRDPNNLSNPSLSESLETSDKDICRLSNSIEIHHNKGIPSSNPDGINVTVTTVVGYQDGCDDSERINNMTTDTSSTNEDYKENADVSPNASTKLPRIKTIPELNHLLKRQNQRFSENLCSEYGIVISEDNYIEEGGSSKWTSDNEEIQLPQILNTFSLSDDSMWDSVETSTDKAKADFTTQNNFNNIQSSLLKYDLQNVETENTKIEKRITDTGFKSNQEVPQNNSSKNNTKPSKYISLTPLKNLQRTQQIDGDVTKEQDPDIKTIHLPDLADYEEALGSHFITKTKSPVSKKTAKPTRSLETSCKQKKFKIKTTNNIILINRDQMPSTPSGEDDEKLYQSNFGNILQHYLNTSSVAQSNVQCPNKNPIKLVLPRNYFSPYDLVKPESKLKNGIYSSGLPTQDKWPPPIRYNTLSKDNNLRKLDIPSSLTQAKVINSSIQKAKDTTKSTKQKYTNIILVEDSPPPSNSEITEKEKQLNSLMPNCNFSTITGQMESSVDTPPNITIHPTLKTRETELRTATVKLEQSVNCENQAVKQLSSTQDNTISSVCGVKRHGSFDETTDFSKSMRASNENC